MSKNHSVARLALLLAASLCLLLASLAGAQETDDPVKVRVHKVIKSCDGDDCAEGAQVRHRIKVIKDCDGEDCAEGTHKVLFVGDDGETQVIEGTGGNVSWVSSDDGAHAVRMMAHHPKAFLGVQMSELTPELRTHFGVPDDAGVMVSKVVEDSPAYRAGIRVGDIVSAIDGKPVASANGLSKAIGAHEAGQAVNVELWRDGRVQTLSPTLEKPQMKMRHAAGKAHVGGSGQNVFLEKLAGDASANAKVVVIECDGEDCDESAHELHFGNFECGDSGECEVQVQCENGECSCTVNGETAACPDAPGGGN